MVEQGYDMSYNHSTKLVTISLDNGFVRDDVKVVLKDGSTGTMTDANVQHATDFVQMAVDRYWRGKVVE